MKLDYTHRDGTVERFDATTDEAKQESSKQILKLMLLEGFIPTPGDPVCKNVPTCSDSVSGKHEMTRSFVEAIRVMNNKPVTDVVMCRGEDYSPEGWSEVMQESAFKDDPELVVTDSEVLLLLTPFDVLMGVPNHEQVLEVVEKGFLKLVR